ncbi:MAG: hypothetical protein HFF79_09055 [Oscillospiraceae bacterium]|nr:hypothetical protein [Oscillospiraceae bacterium]MCI8877660.1 hypothetical protein [Oscillospiraceae bacterium]
MKRNRKLTAWVAFTAMGAALVTAAQYLGGLIPDIAVIFGPFSVRQLITGTLVNCVLLVFTARAGLASGAVIGVLSAVLAGLLGISQLVLSPVVAAGNAILCLVYWFLEERMNHISGVIAGAALKCGFLWLTAPLVLSIAGLPEKQAAMLSIMFSWPQFVTALCGGLLAWSVLPRVRRRQRGNI